MRFLVDAQLPRRLATEPTDLGYDSIHTLVLPNRNAAKDGEVAAVADQDDRVVVTKDEDFRVSHLVKSQPRRLLHVTTGNITNAVLLELVRTHLIQIERAFERSRYVELTADSLIIHPDRGEREQPDDPEG